MRYIYGHPDTAIHYLILFLGEAHVIEIQVRGTGMSQSTHVNFLVNGKVTHVPLSHFFEKFNGQWLNATYTPLKNDLYPFQCFSLKSTFSHCPLKKQHSLPFTTIESYYGMMWNEPTLSPPNLSGIDLQMIKPI